MSTTGPPQRSIRQGILDVLGYETLRHHDVWRAGAGRAALIIDPSELSVSVTSKCGSPTACEPHACEGCDPAIDMADLSESGIAARDPKSPCFSSIPPPVKKILCG